MFSLAVLSQTIAVIGSGYVGLTLSASLALLGHNVECTESHSNVYSSSRAGSVPIVEEGLTEVIEQMLAAGRLRFSTDNTLAAGTCGLCLSVPAHPHGGRRMGRSLLRSQVAEEIGPHLRPGAVVITKSTVPVGTGAAGANSLGRGDLHVVSNPEFLAEGTALRDCLRPDRVVVGAASEAVATERGRPVWSVRRLPIGPYGRDERRTHQVRVQRLPGGPPHIRELDSRDVRRWREPIFVPW